MSSASITGLQVSRASSPLRMTFTTALRSTDVIESVRVGLHTTDGVMGLGEATPVTAVTGETLASVEDAIHQRMAAVVRGRSADDLDGALAALHQVADERDPGAAAALDLALHDLAARRRGLTLGQLLAERAGWDCEPRPSVATDMTLSVASPAAMASAAQAAVADGFEVIKLKLGGGGDDFERLRAVRYAVGPDIVLRLDANQAWERDVALRFVAAIEREGIAIDLLEQPVAAADLDGLAAVTAASRFPVLADEAVFSAADVVMVGERGAASMVNLKLMKCGGLGPALEAVRTARHYGLGWIVGCMMEGVVGVVAAASLAALAEPSYVHDLDAAWWQASTSLNYAGGRLALSPRPGFEGVS